MIPNDPTIQRDIADLQRRTRTLESIPRERPWYNVRLMGATGDGVTDDYDAIQAAITAAEVDGGTVYFPPGGIYFLNKASGGGLKLGRDNTGLRNAVVLSGYGATILLSTNVPRFLDFNKIADHDVFRNIFVEGFEIDSDNVGGAQHVIIGSILAGVTQTRFNVDRLTIRDVRAYNIAQDSTAVIHRLGIHIVVNRSAAGTGTDGAENYLTNIRFENVRIEGGNAGIFVGGGGPDVVGLLIFMDEVHIDRCWHDTGVTPTASYPSSNFQLCSRAYGRNCSIRDSQGFNSGDVGVEVNAMTRVLCDGVTIEDCYNVAFYARQYNTLDEAQHQLILFKDCHARLVDVSGALLGTYGFRVVPLGMAGVEQHGQVTIEDCSMHWACASPWKSSAISAGYCEELNIVRFQGTCTTLNYTAGAGAAWELIDFSAGSTIACRIKVRDMRLDISGTRDVAAGTFVITGVEVRGSAIVLDIDGLDIDFNITNCTTNGMVMMDIGDVTTIVTGVIRRVKCGTTGDAGPYGIQIRGTGLLTITEGLFIENCDFTGLVPAGDAVRFVTGNENKDKVFFNNNIWVTFPAIAVAITPGASPYTYTNLDGYKETVVISGGTVSVIALSVDGTNFYTTGEIVGAFVLSNNDAVKVTYSVVPTMTKLPHKH